MKIKLSALSMVAILMAGCEKPPQTPPPLRPALVIVVGQTAVEQGMVLVGEVKSRYESNQGFRIGGKIIERKVEVGTVVKKGQVLALLDASDTNLTAAAAYADVRAAEASHALARAEVERQRLLFNNKIYFRFGLRFSRSRIKNIGGALATG